jgi:hypothetical protein
MDDDDDDGIGGYTPRSTRKSLLVAEDVIFGTDLLKVERILTNQLEALAALSHAKVKYDLEAVAAAVSQTVARLESMLPGGPLQ